MINGYLKKSFKNSSDGKILMSNLFYLSILQIASYFFPLITIPYLAKTIGVEGFGKIAFAAAIMVWIQTIADWGFNFTATRDVAKNRENSDYVAHVFSDVLWARFLLMIISFIILIILLLFIPSFKENTKIILISFLMIPGHVLFPDWFFQAMEKMKYITILNLLAKTIFTLLIFVFVNQEEDYIIQPLLTSIGYLISGLISLYIIYIKWQYKIKKPEWNNIIERIKGGMDIFINNLMPNLYNSLSMIILGMVSGSVSNGKFEAGSKITNACISLTHVVARVFFPYLSRKPEKQKIFAQYSLVSAAIITILIFIFSPYIYNVFFTNEFNGTIIVLRIMSLSLFFIVLNDVYGKNYLIINGYDHILRTITTKVSIIGMFIGFPLIYYADYIGAAITVTFTRALLGLSIYYTSRKIIKERL